ncbi:MAG: hypothetical protein QM757_08560 [Paludibaculum sp.]
MPPNAVCRCALLAAIAFALATAAEVPVLTVCEILRNPGAYHGKSVIVVGKHEGWSEGSVIRGSCAEGGDASGARAPIGIRLDADPVHDGANRDGAPDYRTYRSSILEKLPPGISAELEFLEINWYTGAAAAVFGRFEINRPPQGMAPLISPKGFGHLNGYPARLVSPPHSFWNLVPRNELPALRAAERERTERAMQAMWHALQISLTRETGPEWFKTNLDGRLLPTLKGTVLESQTDGYEDRLLIVMAGSKTPEAELRVGRSSSDPIPVGSIIEFEGIARKCAYHPFLLTMEVSGTGLRVITPGPNVRQPSEPPRD